ncbi:hypothetical protein BJX70DRAFT_128460 [Aspergillus crustosus]
MSYRHFVQAQQHNNPCLAGLSNFLFDSNSDRQSCRILKVDFSTGTGPEFQHVSIKDLEEHIHPAEKQLQRRGRILIVEDVCRNVIETLGTAYRIDPIFFASHIHAPFRQMSNQTPNLATLPSRQRKQNFVNFHYHRAVELRGRVQNEQNLTRDMNVDRKIVVLLPSERTRVALVQHACSVILLPDTKDSHEWLGIILVDSPILSGYLPVLYANGMESGDQLPRRNSRIECKLFLDGYEDFLPPISAFFDMAIKDAFCHPRLPRGGLLEDLQYYWNRELPQEFDALRPSLFALSIYPLKIIAAEWNNYMAAMSYHIKRHEYAVEAANREMIELDKLNVELRSLQAWRRRSLASQHKIASVKNFLALHTSHATHHASHTIREDEIELKDDYIYLADTLDDLSRRLKNMLPVVTSLVQISDSRRSLAESANINRLTSLAIVFVPLSFTTGLFSMNTTNGPGGANFWVFFTIAIPITIIVLLIAKPPIWIVHWIFNRDRTSPRLVRMKSQV